MKFFLYFSSGMSMVGQFSAPLERLEEKKLSAFEVWVCIPRKRIPRKLHHTKIVNPDTEE